MSATTAVVIGVTVELGVAVVAAGPGGVDVVVSIGRTGSAACNVGTETLVVAEGVVGPVADVSEGV